MAEAEAASATLSAVVGLNQRVFWTWACWRAQVVNLGLVGGSPAQYSILDIVRVCRKAHMSRVCRALTTQIASGESLLFVSVIAKVATMPLIECIHALRWMARCGLEDGLGVVWD